MCKDIVEQLKVGQPVLVPLEKIDQLVAALREKGEFKYVITTEHKFVLLSKSW